MNGTEAGLASAVRRTQGTLPGILALFAAAAGFVVVAWTSPFVPLRLPALVAGLTLLALGALLSIRARLRALSVRGVERRLSLMLAEDAAPCFTTDEAGAVGYRNRAAEGRFGTEAATLVAALGDHFATPSAVLYRLQARARNHGAAREDVVTRRGHTRLSVHRLGEGRYLWRLEEFQDRAGPGRGAEALTLPMMTASKQGVVLFTNEAMRRLLGGRPKRLDRVFATDDLRSGEEVEIATADGPVRAILGEIEGVAGRREVYLLPVADRAAANPATDFDQLPVPLMAFAPDGALRQANQAARELLGLGPEAMPAVHDLFDGLGRPVADWLADVAAGRLPAGSEVLNARGVGPEAFVQLTLRRSADQASPGVVAVLQDATALKRLEAQMAQSQKMQAIGQLAGGIAHDFNNLLTAISGHCDLLLLRHDSGDGDYADLIQIHQNANRAAALVGQLLAFSRKQTLKPERLELEEVLSETAHLLNRLVGEKVQLRFTHGTGIGPIRADRRKLEQVIMNLVVNARDAMAAGGTVRIETEARHLGEEAPRGRVTLPAGDYALIRVSDTGCGIAPELQEKIFEPFFTTKRVGEGTGLGLAMVYGIVKQSGGYIFVTSREGEGTSFELWFPVHQGSAEAEPAPAARPSVLRACEGVVLLVEDEAPVRAFASRALRMRGLTVLEAENAEEALRKLEDPGLKVDVFVTDVVMPGMDGPSWVRLALEERPEVRTIFVSGYAEDALSEMQARIPNSVFLPKPFSLADLAETVQGQLLH